MKKPLIDKVNKQYLFVICVLFSLSFAACSESDENEDEYANWKERNDAYFNNVYNQAKDAIAKGSAEWKIIRNWSLNEDMASKPDDYIVVQVIEEGHGSGSPLYTDSVMVHYRGRYIPTAHYPEGYVFDQSYTGAYEPKLLKPTSFVVNRLVDGFTTALMNMHIGDRWRVYVPYMLAYGLNDTTTSSGGVKYSYKGSTLLIFDISLVAYFHPGAEIPSWNSKSSVAFYDEKAY